jgi:hypothetical protein
MDGLAAYPQKKKFPGISPREQLLFCRLIIVTVNGYRSTTSNKGSGLYDLIGISSQEMHKYRVQKTNVFNPVALLARGVQTKFIACNRQVLQNYFIGLIANEVTIMITFDHNGFSIERN